MKQNLQITLIIFFLGLGCLTAQDENFTQYEFAPVFVNPANTGGFLGTFRLGGLYRNRAPSFEGSYKTLHFDMEMNFGFAFRKVDWTSLSISFLQDRSGVINLGTGGFLASAAYHLALGKGDLAIGGQFGSNSYSAKSPEKAILPEQFASGGGMSSQDRSRISQGKADFTDIGAGVVYTTPLTNKKHTLKLGIAANHIGSPSASIAGAGYEIPMLLSGSATLVYHYSEKIDLMPMIWFRNLENASETVPQCMVSYLFNVEKQIRLNAGLGYRFGDAVQLMAGMNYGKLKAQVGFDMTTSNLAKADGSGLGGLEIAVMYIGSITKKPNPKPKVFCPRF